MGGWQGKEFVEEGLRLEGGPLNFCGGGWGEGLESVGVGDSDEGDEVAENFEEGGGEVGIVVGCEEGEADGD